LLRRDASKENDGPTQLARYRARSRAIDEPWPESDLTPSRRGSGRLRGFCPTRQDRSDQGTRPECLTYLYVVTLTSIRAVRGNGYTTGQSRDSGRSPIGPVAGPPFCARSPRQPQDLARRPRSGPEPRPKRDVLTANPYQRLAMSISAEPDLTDFRDRAVGRRDGALAQGL
jgi:hypothetical protein